MSRFIPTLENLDDRLNPSQVLAPAEPEVTPVVRHRFFSIVDRTSITPLQTRTGGADSVWIDLGAPAASTDSGNTIYVTTANGGVWKTRDSGRSW